MYDIHCHIDVLPSPPRHVRGLISAGIKPSSWAAHRTLASQLPINVSLGLHPFFVTADSLGEIDLLDTYLDDPSVIAVGEIGLDYHKGLPSDRHAQMTIFKEQMFQASLRGLPVIIHCRKAYDELFECLKDVDVPRTIFHAFSGHEHDHRRAMDREDYLSFGFPITYSDNKKQRAMLAATPLERVLLETDAPYMKRLGDDPTTPDEIAFVYEAAAEIKGVALEDMIVQVQENARCIWPQFREFDP